MTQIVRLANSQKLAEINCFKEKSTSYHETER